MGRKGMRTSLGWGEKRMPPQTTLRNNSQNDGRAKNRKQWEERNREHHEGKNKKKKHQ